MTNVTLKYMKISILSSTLKLATKTYQLGGEYLEQHQRMTGSVEPWGKCASNWHSDAPN